jgi:hypothetical protein
MKIDSGRRFEGRSKTIPQGDRFKLNGKENKETMQRPRQEYHVKRPNGRKNYIERQCKRLRLRERI